MQIKSNTFFIIILLLIISCLLSIFVDIPIIKELISYIVLTIVPGLLILQIMKLNKISTLEKILLSIALSLSYLMFAGLVFNSLFQIFQIQKPLTSQFMQILLCISLFLLLIIGYKINKKPLIVINDNFLQNFDFNMSEKFILLFSVILISLSIIGTILMKYYGNPIIMITMMVSLGFLIITTVGLHNRLRSNIYPILIFSISLSIIISLTFITNYIYGTDSHKEFYLFNLVYNTGAWKVFDNTTLDSCLSISLLPAIYQTFMQMDLINTFKFIYILPLSITPLVVYLIAKRYVDNFYAFIAAIFLISQNAFFSQLGAYRTYVALLFFSLAILYFFNDDIKDAKKKLLFIIFTASCIISHYSTTYIFFGIIVLSWILINLLIILSKKSSLDKIYAFNLKTKLFSFTIIILFFVMFFFWNSQVTGASFNEGIGFFSKTFSSLSQFFSIESRDPVVSQAFGSTLKNAPLLRYINFFSSWGTIILISLGIIITGIKILKDLFYNKNQKFRFTSDIGFYCLGLSCFIILGLTAITPFISIGYGLDRAYYQILIILSVFFVLGGIYIAKYVKIPPEILLLLIFLPTLFTSIGLLPQLFGTPYSILLNQPDTIKDGQIYYIHDPEAFAGNWIKQNKDPRVNNFYSDFTGGYRLLSTANVPITNIDRYSIISNYTQFDDGYLYLGYSNVINNKIYIWKIASIWEIYDKNKLEYKTENSSLIYNNGYSELWKTTN